MEVTLQIPEPIAKTLGYAADSLPRRALEALLVDASSHTRFPSPARESVRSQQLG